MLVKKILPILLLSLFKFDALANMSDDVLGYWATEDDKGTVLITKENGKYLGKLIWIDIIHRKEKTKDQVVDDKNPNPKKHKNSVLGITLLENFNFNKEKSRWDDGQIYDPENGKTYSCKMWFDGDKDQLQIRGFIGISLFGRTTVWRRIDGPIPMSYRSGGENFLKYNLGIN